MDLRILPPDEILSATVELPLSKSISARTLIIDAIAGLPLTSRVADCDDTKALAAALSDDSHEINIGAAGTAMRFLTAYYAGRPGSDVILDGDDRMRQRPIGRLVDALRRLGADISYAGTEGFPPLRITGTTLSGGEIDVDASVSSQYVSAIMMVAPLMSAPLRVNLPGDVVSRPYITMTAKMMAARGIDVDINPTLITIGSGCYTAATTEVERDWSAASYWYEIAALTAGWVTLPGLSLPSLQGDSALAGLFPRLGVLTEFEDGAAELSATPDLFSRLEFDMSDTPDLVQTFVVTACAIGIPFRLTGVSTLRIKETDRIGALCRELLKIGCVVSAEGDDVISWECVRRPITELPRIDTYGDHRMAMAFAPLAVFIPGIIINDIEVVSKSYPGYWSHLTEAGFRLIDAETPLTDINEEA